MIAENVVFVQDDEGHNYYIPKDKINNWKGWLETWDYYDGIIPDYAVSVEGETFVVNIVEVL